MSDNTILTYTEIDREAWSRLVQTSRTGTWFQSPEAYAFFASMPQLFAPFAVGLMDKPEYDSGLINEETLRAVCVGYVSVEKNPLKQFFTRRAIIIGGPCLAEDCSEEEVSTLLEAVKTKTQHLQSPDSDLPETTPQSACMQASIHTEDLSRVAANQQDALQKHASLTKNTRNIFYHSKPIYIETRNFNDYSKWKRAFEKAGFAYKPHMNFHVDCTDKEKMWERLSDNRRRQIRRVTNERVNELTNERISEEEIREWYGILQELYRTKVRTPLLPLEFFVQAYRQGVGQFLLVKHEGKVIGGSMVVELTNEGVNELTSERRGCVYEWYECGLNAKYKEQYPSVMATWAGMNYAHEQGCARYDMMGAGEPRVPYGVRDFKAEFGGEMVEHGRFLCIAKPLLYRLGVIGLNIIKRQ